MSDDKPEEQTEESEISSDGELANGRVSEVVAPTWQYFEGACGLFSFFRRIDSVTPKARHPEPAGTHLEATDDYYDDHD